MFLGGDDVINDIKGVHVLHPIPYRKKAEGPFHHLKQELIELRDLRRLLDNIDEGVFSGEGVFYLKGRLIGLFEAPVEKVEEFLSFS